ncbi:hypothetical protein CRUP_000404, partial [Coryphaenoides rupestris]
SCYSSCLSEHCDKPRTEGKQRPALSPKMAPSSSPGQTGDGRTHLNEKFGY